MQVIAYKGFDKDLKCRGFQYEVGKTYEEPEAVLCEKGFHACEAPLDVFRYYVPTNGNRFCVVELDDVSGERSSEDSKIVGKKITVDAEIGIPGLAKAHFEYVKTHTNYERSDPNAATAGDRGAATAGDRGAATAGYGGAATAGDGGAATSRWSASVGEDDIACVRGNNVKIRGGMGAMLTIGIENESDYNLKEWKSVVVDGETAKANTWYTLRDGELVEIPDV